MKQLKTIILTSVITITIMVMGLAIYAKTVDLNTAIEEEKFAKTDLQETDFTKQILTAKVVSSVISENKENYSLNFSLPVMVKNEDKSAKQNAIDLRLFYN